MKEGSHQQDTKGCTEDYSHRQHLFILVFVRVNESQRFPWLENLLQIPKSALYIPIYNAYSVFIGENRGKGQLERQVPIRS
jgi:hypothetical protein